MLRARQWTRGIRGAGRGTFSPRTSHPPEASAGGTPDAIARERATHTETLDRHRPLAAELQWTGASAMRRAIQKLLRLPPFRILLRLGVRVFAPRNLVGVVGVIFNSRGEILLAEHVYRSRYRWGLPGGWVQRGEDPADALKRELREELELDVDVEQVLLCRTEATADHRFSTRSIGVAFLCTAGNAEPSISSSELLATRWASPAEIGDELLPFQRTAVELALRSEINGSGSSHEAAE